MCVNVFLARPEFVSRPKFTHKVFITKRENGHPAAACNHCLKKKADLQWEL